MRGLDATWAKAHPPTALLYGLLIAAVLLPRALAFPINENLHGDAVARTELAQRWAADPHWITSFADGAYQFGPLHLYAVGLALKVWPSPEHAGRLVSLLFGVLSVLPLYLLTRRLFGWKAGLAAGLAFAAWGMHVQMATTAGSEALSLFLVLCVLALFAKGWDEGTLGPLFGAALFLNLACATRYDAWLLVPLLTALLVFRDRDKVAALTRAAVFGLLCLPFPLAWMQGNEMDTGQMLRPIQYIEAFHQGWVSAGVSQYGELAYRAHNLFFWPAVAFFTLTPLIALFGLIGMVQVFRRQPERRWLVWVAAVPTAYFAFRGAVLLNFAPLGRFTVGQVALLLPFIEPGFQAALAKVGEGGRRLVIGTATAIAIAMPLLLGAYTYRAEEGPQLALAPVSPISTNPPAVTQVARFVGEAAAQLPGEVILDADRRYLDIQVGFFSGVDPARLIRVRWDGFGERLEKADPLLVVRVEGGALETHDELLEADGGIRLGQYWFRELPGFRPPFRVYQRVRGPGRSSDFGTADAAPSPPGIRPAPRAN
jgi:4-amino-4-deoxy-L-arabinose transferase-like glycosyltransferase